MPRKQKACFCSASTQIRHFQNYIIIYLCGILSLNFTDTFWGHLRLILHHNGSIRIKCYSWWKRLLRLTDWIEDWDATDYTELINSLMTLRHERERERERRYHPENFPTFTHSDSNYPEPPAARFESIFPVMVLHQLSSLHWIETVFIHADSPFQVKLKSKQIASNVDLSCHI